MNLRRIIEWLGVIAATLLFVYAIKTAHIKAEFAAMNAQLNRIQILELQAQAKDLQLKIIWLNGRRDRHNHEWDVVLRSLRTEIEDQ